MRNVVYRPALLLALIMGIYVLSSVRGHTQAEEWTLVWLVGKTPPLVQKVMHVLLYAALSWLVYGALESLSLRTSYRVIIAFLVSVSFGGFNEWHQLQMPGRFGTAVDVALNAFGAALGLLVAVLI